MAAKRAVDTAARIREDITDRARRRREWDQFVAAAGEGFVSARLALDTITTPPPAKAALKVIVGQITDNYRRKRV